MNKRILIDCDGVIANLIFPLLKYLNKQLGTKFEHQHIIKYDILESLGLQHMWPEVLKNVMYKKSFTEKLPVYPGSKEALIKLSEYGKIYIVTSPLDAPHWVPGRKKWLKEHFNIGKDRTTNTEAKHTILGNVLIDDRAENVLIWKEHFPKGLAILWDAPYNTWLDAEANGIIRTRDWSVVIERVSKLEDSHKPL